MLQTRITCQVNSYHTRQINRYHACGHVIHHGDGGDDHGHGARARGNDLLQSIPHH